MVSRIGVCGFIGLGWDGDGEDCCHEKCCSTLCGLICEVTCLGWSYM